MEKNQGFAQILTQEWRRRQKINRRYSLRAFAKNLSISPSRLSDLLNGKGGISATRALEIAERLNLSEEELEGLSLIIQKDMPTAKSLKNFAVQTLKKRKFSYSRSISCKRTIERLSWEHLYIAEILSQKPLHQNEIAKRLSIHHSQLAVFLHEAQKMELIEGLADDPGMWRAKDASRYFAEAKSSAPIRKLHFQILKKIPELCEMCDSHERELNTSLLQLEPEQIEKLTQMIRDFTKASLAEANKSNSEKKRLYGLSIQLFPIENKKENL